LKFLINKALPGYLVRCNE